MATRFNSKIRGFSLVEVVIAISIVGIIGVSGLAALYVLVHSSAEAVKQVQATNLLTEGIEAVKFMRDISWEDNIDSLTRGADYQLEFEAGIPQATTTAVSLLPDFWRTIKISDVYRDITGDIVSTGGTLDENTLLLTVTVSWPVGSPVKEKKIETYVANVFEN